MEVQLPEREIVLLGVGHTNAHVLRMWRMNPIPNARLTCISKYPTITYSGMLPGVLSGHYSPDRMEIDLVRACAAAGARLIIDDVVGLGHNLFFQQLEMANRPPIPFSYLSIGVGSTPDWSGVDVEDGSVLSIKPMQTFLSRIAARIDELRNVVRERHLRLVIVGAGAGGTEIALCLPHYVRRVLGCSSLDVTLIDSHNRIIRGTGQRTADLLRKKLELVRTKVLLDRRVKLAAKGQLVLDNDEVVPADIVVWATKAKPPDVLDRLDLTRDHEGFVRVRPTLQTVDHNNIFAVGDSASIDGINPPLPKAGVYAVRQGPVLWENLRRLMSNSPPVCYEPQRSFLKLINTGDGRAVGEYKGLTFSGAWCWKWKDRIDSRFMKMYQDYTPSMASPTQAPPFVIDVPKPARCTGCGGKLGRGILSQVLSRLKVVGNDRVLSGLAELDDVAVLKPSPHATAITVDFFTWPVDDPFVVGRLAAIHSLSDAFASGVKPTAALAIASIPEGSPESQSQCLYELLAGSIEEFKKVSVSLVGGHTVEGGQPTIGFTIVGDRCPQSTLSKSALRVGDALVLTKPIGIGVLLAAHMQARCHGKWFQSLLATMLESNHIAADLLAEYDVSGMTDVTGFGLAGHLSEMLSASKVGAKLYLRRIPILDGTCDLISNGIESTLAPSNRIALNVEPEVKEMPEFRALFDPQTCGGLLFGIRDSQAAEFLSRFHEKTGVKAAAKIGKIVSTENAVRITVENR